MSKIKIKTRIMSKSKRCRIDTSPNPLPDRGGEGGPLAGLALVGVGRALGEVNARVCNQMISATIGSKTILINLI